MTLVLALIWAAQSGALIEWQQARILEWMQPVLEQIATPTGAAATPSSPGVP